MIQRMLQMEASLRLEVSMSQLMATRRSDGAAGDDDGVQHVELAARVVDVQLHQAGAARRQLLHARPHAAGADAQLGPEDAVVARLAPRAAHARHAAQVPRRGLHQAQHVQEQVLPKARPARLRAAILGRGATAATWLFGHRAMI